MADEDFHEIQLNGKQLVFLFMAGTVAAGGIFLCGLMVARNLHGPHLEAAAATPDATVVDPTRPTEQALPPPSDTSSSGTPVTTRETLTYSTRLEDPTPAEETLRPNDIAPKPATPKPLAKETPAAGDEPPGSGWGGQGQAGTSRTEADALGRP